MFTRRRGKSMSTSPRCAPNFTIPTRRHFDKMSSSLTGFCSRDMTKRSVAIRSQLLHESRSMGNFKLDTRATSRTPRFASLGSFDSSAVLQAPTGKGIFASSCRLSSDKFLSPSPRERSFSTLEGKRKRVLDPMRSPTQRRKESPHSPSFIQSSLPVPLTRRCRWSGSSLASPKIEHLNQSQSKLHANTEANTLDLLWHSISQSSGTDEVQNDHIQTITEDFAPENSIKISLTYKTNLKKLEVQIHGLTVPRCNRARKLRVELTLSPGNQRFVVGVSSSGDPLPNKVVFHQVPSFSLASQSLSIKVYNKGLLMKRKKVLYQTLLPLTDASLKGKVNWVPLRPAHVKANSSISISMCYLVWQGKLAITVLGAKDLKKNSLRKGTYVEVNFLRGCDESSKMQTFRTKPNCSSKNPVYKEIFCFQLSPIGSSSYYTELTFTVRRRNFGRADETLGRVTLSNEMSLDSTGELSAEKAFDEVFKRPGKAFKQTHFLSH